MKRIPTLGPFFIFDPRKKKFCSKPFDFLFIYFSFFMHTFECTNLGGYKGKIKIKCKKEYIKACFFCNFKRDPLWAFFVFLIDTFLPMLGKKTKNKVNTLVECFPKINKKKSVFYLCVFFFILFLLYCLSFSLSLSLSLSGKKRNR